MQHRGLADDRPAAERAVQHISLTLQLVLRIDVVHAGEQRIAHPAPGVQIVAVSVDGNGGNVHELGLFFAHSLHRVHHVAGADEVGELSPLRVVIGRGRDDRPHMEDVVGVRDQPLAGLGVGEVSPHRLHALAVQPARRGGELLVSLRAADEDLDLFHLIELEELPQALPSHISACSREGNFDRHKSLLLFLLHRHFNP